ncbi:MAG: phosphate ABC transporter permease family protein, partial [Pseudomonadota bacterium]
MPMSTLMLVVAVLAVVAFVAGQSRSARGVQARTARWHSLPVYHGYFTAAWCALPALAVIALYIAGHDALVQSMVGNSLPQNIRDLPDDELALIV